MFASLGTVFGSAPIYAPLSSHLQSSALKAASLSLPDRGFDDRSVVTSPEVMTTLVSGIPRADDVNVGLLIESADSISSSSESLSLLESLSS